MDAVLIELKEERNTAFLAAAQLRRNKLRLSAQNERLKDKATKSFNDAKEALTEVIETSKG